MVNRRAGLLAVLAAVLVLYSPFWLLGRVFVPEDFLAFIYPWKAQATQSVSNLELFDVAVFFFPQDVFLNERLKAGDIPLWNPHIFAGHPIVASGQSGLMYPPRLLMHWWLEPGAARSLLLLVHSLLAGWMALVWLKSRGLGEFGAGVGGLVWMLNGQAASWLEFEHVVLTGPFVPAMFWCIDRGLETRVPRYWALLALAGGLCVHTGHLQMVFYAGLLTVFYALVRIVSSGQVKALFSFAAAGVGVVALAAPTVLPFLDLLRRSGRVAFEFAQLKQFTPSLSSLVLTLFGPDLLGNPSRGLMVNRCEANLIYPEFANYLGLLPLLLGLMALLVKAESPLGRREEWAWGGLGIAALLWSAATPFYKPLVLLIPPLSKAMPTRFLYLLAMAGAVLAAAGAEKWEQELEGASLWLRRLSIASAVLGGVILVASVVALWAFPDQLLAGLSPYFGQFKIPPAQEPYQPVLLEALKANYLGNPQAYVPLVVGLATFGLTRAGSKRLALILIAVDLLLFATHFNTTTPAQKLLPTTPAISFLQEQPGRFRVERQAAGFYNTMTPYGLTLLTGYESMITRRFQETVRRVEPDGRITMRSIGLSHFDSPILSVMNVRFLIQAPLELSPPQGWTKVYDGECLIFENPKALERAFLVGQAFVAEHPGQALQYLAGEKFEPSQEVVLEFAPPGPIEEAAAQGQVTILSYQPDEVLLEAQLPAPGFLVLSDAFYPGWECRSSLGKLPIFPANGASRAVYLPAGRHQINFVYRPKEVDLGLKLAGVGLLVLLPLLFLRGDRVPNQKPAR